MATIVTPWAANQSDRSRRSRVMVAKVLMFLATLPAGSTRRTQATTVRLWTSRPAQQACSTSIGESPQDSSHGATSRRGSTLLSVLDRRRDRRLPATSSGSGDVLHQA